MDMLGAEASDDCLEFFTFDLVDTDVVVVVETQANVILGKNSSSDARQNFIMAGNCEGGGSFLLLTREGKHWLNGDGTYSLRHPDE